MKINSKIIYVPERILDRINRYLTIEPDSEEDCLSEDTTISYTAKFDEHYEMDVKCCGVQFREGESNLAWTEAVLFKNGCAIAMTEPSDGFEGEWEIEADGNIYKIIIRKEIK